MASTYVDSCHDPLQLCIQGFCAGQWMGRQLSWVGTRDREKEKRVLFDIHHLHIFVGENAKAANLRLLRTIVFALLSMREAEEGAFLSFFVNAASSLESLRHLNLNEIANCLALHAHIWIGFAWFLNWHKEFSLLPSNASIWVLVTVKVLLFALSDSVCVCLLVYVCAFSLTPCCWSWLVAHARKCPWHLPALHLSRGWWMMGFRVSTIIETDLTSFVQIITFLQQASSLKELALKSKVSLTLLTVSLLIPSPH